LSKRTYAGNPLVAVGAVIFKNEKLLLVKRGKEPHESSWTFPGGVVELGETIESCIIREVLEECGITIRPTRLIEVIDYIEKDELNQIKYHYVIIDFEAEIITGELHAGSDAKDVGWFDDNELPKLNLPAITRTFLKKHYFK
jgi:ADP-ribose pyrophosphatase